MRWLLGLIAPLVLGWMAWETARIRSTQSATGILYVVVIVCFLGELMSQLLRGKDRLIMSVTPYATGKAFHVKVTLACPACEQPARRRSDQAGRLAMPGLRSSAASERCRSHAARPASCAATMSSTRKKTFRNGSA